MENIDSLLRNRRSVYQLGKDIAQSDEEVIRLVEDLTRLVPDAFNMKSQRVVLALGEKQNQLWDTVYDVFGGKVAREKIDGFKAAHGTVLYFYDKSVVEAMQKNFPRYADNFPVWAQQANGMLQVSVWTGLRAMGIGANIQHYNPVIDNAVRKLFHLPDSYIPVAQMPFGKILGEPAPKEEEDISKRFRVAK